MNLDFCLHSERILYFSAFLSYKGILQLIYVSLKQRCHDCGGRVYIFILTVEAKMFELIAVHRRPLQLMKLVCVKVEVIHQKLVMTQAVGKIRPPQPGCESPVWGSSLNPAGVSS